MEIKAITQQHRATADQRLQTIEQFRRSGLTRAAFSRQYGIPLATLSYWLAKAKRASNLPVPVVFSEVRLTAPEASSPNAWAMEVVAPSGLTIRYREALATRDLVRLMRSGRC
jgi:transposase-like protein